MWGMAKKSQKITPLSSIEGNLLPSDVDIKAYKSMFYLLNAKPDTEIKFLKEKRRIELEDIYNLNEKVQEKLKTLNVVVGITSLDVIFYDKRAKSFGSWLEFTQVDWVIPQKIKTINITWDFSLKLPQYRVPQRHTLKVRLGTKPRTSEIFHIVVDEDDLELDEYLSSVVCKVDFINPLIADELINIVSIWYESLSQIHKRSKLDILFDKYPKQIADLVSYLIPITVLILTYSIVNNFVQIPNQISNWTLFLREIVLGLTVVTISLIIAFFIGQILSHYKVLHTLLKLRDYSMFNITKGDINRNKEVKEENSKVIKELSLQALVYVVFSFIVYILPYITKLLFIKR